MRIETERLIITELSMDMAKDLHLNSLDEDNRRFVPDEVFETVEEAAETDAAAEAEEVPAVEEEVQPEEPAFDPAPANKLFQINVERNHVWGYSNHVEYAEGFRVIKMLER